MDKKVLELLRGIGLTESESKVYVANLGLGPATAINLSKEAGLTRQMIYSLLPGLMKRGFIKEVYAGVRRRFVAVDPQVLADFAKQNLAAIEQAVPSLRSTRARNATLPSVTIYDNPISMREWYREFMAVARRGDRLLIWATNKIWYAEDEEFLKKFLAFKRRLGVIDWIIAPDLVEARKNAAKLQKAQPKAEYRFAKAGWGAEVEKWIWKDTVAYLTISGASTNLIVIESAAIAALERFNFEQAWKGLKPT